MGQQRVYTAKDATDGYLVRAKLEMAGLTVHTRGEHLMGLAGKIPVPDAKLSLWVDDADVPRAEAVLDELRKPQLVHPEWTCPTCGEVNGPAFEFCWKCETPR